MRRNHRLVEGKQELREEMLRRRRSPPTARAANSLPTHLHHVEQDLSVEMRPGDFVRLDHTESRKCSVEPTFYAVLACPRCGTLGLISSAQYFRAVPVICGSRLCSCRFRIDDENRLVYLPVN